jgi:hypothetical protein
MVGLHEAPLKPLGMPPLCEIFKHVARRSEVTELSF